MNLTLIDLLLQWSKIAPNECRIVRLRQGITLFDVEIATIEVIHQFDPIDDRKVLAIVQGAVQQRIVDRGISLNLEIHPGQPRTAELVGTNGTTLTEANHEIMAFAMLKAYLNYLMRSNSSWTVTELK